MLSLKQLLFTCLLISVFVSLPTATKCDSSYYEKYYSARRFLPIKRNSLLTHNFTVQLTRQDRLQNFEQIALVGDHKSLGAWRAQHAVLLNRTQEPYVWFGSVQLPVNVSAHYRYFVAAVDQDTGAVQIRRWESHINARHLNVSTTALNRSDNFGWITAGQREVQNGWLSSGRIVQFRLFRNPLQLNENSSETEQLRIKLQPVEPQTLVPLVPSARANAEYVRFLYGDSFLRAQPEFGVPYKDDDILIFQTTVADLQRVAYLLKIYVTQQGSEQVRLIGYQHIQPELLQGTEGSFSINIISPIWLNAIGSLQLQYLIIAPMSKTTADFRTSFVDYWRHNWRNLDVGHRGLGKSLKQTTNAPAIIENTVASLKASGDLGADLVEFDVQLTSDLVPIIYHDYAIYVCLNSKKPTSKDDLTEVLIKDITYEQLKNLKTYQIVGNKIIEYPAHNNVEHEDHRLFPLFEDFLLKINKTVGFDIEIKWPQLKSDGEWESIQTIDKNLYVDRILEVMQRHGCGRLSFFTSFDADICAMLRYKQNMYPVMFIYASIDRKFEDPRSDTLYEAINTAQAFDLAGIVPNAVFIQRNTSWIQLAQKQQKRVFLWGDDLKDSNSIAWFKQQGPAGVVYDRLDLWLPLNKKNTFSQEADLPGFFELQCTPQQLKKENATIESILSNVNLL